jgi:hypothetical protein
MKLNANINRKSLIQIIVLVVLLAGGGAAFLMQQEGGLGFLTSYFEDEKPAPPPPVAKAPAGPGEGGAPARKPESAIPPTPAKGQVHGKEFAMDGATFRAGTLRLYQGGRDAALAEIQIARLSPSYEVPAGRTFRLTDAGRPDAPFIEVRSAGEGGAHNEFGDKYTLVLEFGRENNRKLPGKLYVKLPEAAKTQVAGTFEADITGFRIIDGKPDLTADDTETLGYLALREVLKDDPDKALKDAVLRDMRLNSAPAVPTGYLEASYQVGEGVPTTQRFQFVKDKGEWRVLRTLRTDQIDEAHPFQAPKAKDRPETLFPHLAAKRLEAETQKKFPKKGIFVSEFVTRYSDKHKVGECAVTYRLEGNEQPLTRTYLFRARAGGWALDRELGGKEKLNVNTGRIEKRA